MLSLIVGVVEPNPGPRADETNEVRSPVTTEPVAKVDLHAVDDVLCLYKPATTKKQQQSIRGHHSEIAG